MKRAYEPTYRTCNRMAEDRGPPCVTVPKVTGCEHNERYLSNLLPALLSFLFQEEERRGRGKELSAVQMER